MKKLSSHNGPRSIYTLLPVELRYRLTGMIQDGWTAAAIADDHEVMQAYQAMGGSFNRSTLTRIRKCAEYRRLAAMRFDNMQNHESDRIAAAALTEQNAAAALGEQASVALMQAIRANIRSAGDTKEVERLVRCVSSLANTSKDSQIDRLRRQAEDTRQKLEESQAEVAALNRTAADLRARIAELEQLVPGVDSSQVAQAMKDRFGV